MLYRLEYRIGFLFTEKVALEIHLLQTSPQAFSFSEKQSWHLHVTILQKPIQRTPKKWYVVNVLITKCAILWIPTNYNKEICQKLSQPKKISNTTVELSFLYIKKTSFLITSIYTNVDFKLSTKLSARFQWNQNIESKIQF